MDYKDAIRELDLAIAEAKEADKWKRSTSYVEVFELAQKALKKQDATGVIDIKNTPVWQSEYFCPNCYTPLIYSMHSTRTEYCDCCGQRLDWLNTNKVYWEDFNKIRGVEE